MKMNILRADRAHEMDVVFEVANQVANIDQDEYGITLYGTETLEGDLWYVVLDQEVVNAISTDTLLSVQELFDLGAAYASFSLGDIDQGIHLILPVRDVETGAEANDVFTDLCNSLTACITAEAYMGTVNDWCHENDINTGR